MAFVEKDACQGTLGRARCGPGRPVAISAEKRRQIVLESLHGLFSEGGLQALTVSAIARRCGMSKRTLYSIFADRDAMLLAYLDSMLAECLKPLAPEQRDLPLPQRLRLMLTFTKDRGTWDFPLAILRLAISNAPDAPEIGRCCAERGGYYLRDLLREELDVAVARKEIPPIDTAATAALLRDMVQVPVLDALLDNSYRPDADDARARVDLALNVFFNGIAPRDT
ncbi:TetR/AcrR family transcriptional regulator [Puniceibacterium sp. HSS470]|jgi:AcrR family transcriptional regulator|nr:TetR/AcrR family transcriptional regulator [Puniceibacterium sp. HSS470]|tara:strand:- start:70373 stop:71047 length:675 start_codon:yes stop_codon:yes gene_type:complete